LNSRRRRNRSDIPSSDIMAGVDGRLAATIGQGLIALFCVWFIAGVIWGLGVLVLEPGALTNTAILSFTALLAWAEFKAITWVARKRQLEEALLAVRPFLTRHTGPAVFWGLVSVVLAFVIPEPFLASPDVDAEAIKPDPASNLIDAWAVTLLWIAVGCVIAPIVEEVLFRGWLQTALIDAGWGPGVSILITSILFGAFHPDIFGATASGVIFGLLRHKTGGLAAPMIAHAVHNAVVGLIAFSRGGPTEMLGFV
jgi:membrane protease YdiL (CAAX protease family)